MYFSSQTGFWLPMMYSCKALNENPNRWKWNITNVWNTMIFQIAGISVLPQYVEKGLPCD